MLTPFSQLFTLLPSSLFPAVTCHNHPCHLLSPYASHVKLRSIGMPIHGKVTQTLNDEEKYPVEQVSIVSLNWRLRS